MAYTGIAALASSDAQAKTNPEAMKYFRRGFELAMEKRYEEALDMYREGVKIDPKVNRFPVVKEGSAQDAYREALAIQKNSPDEAIKLYLKAAELDPESPGPHHQIAGLEYKRGNTIEAIKFLEKAVSISPNFISSIYGLGVIYTLENKPDNGYFWSSANLILEPNSSKRDRIVANIEANKRQLESLYL